MSYRLELADCHDFVKTLPDGSVDAVITDPPYGTGNWRRPTAGAGSNPSAIFEQLEWDKWDGKFLIEALRITKQCVIVFVPQPRIAEVIQLAESFNKPWRLLLWAKTDPRPRFSGQVSYAYEGIVAIGKLEPVGGIDYFLASAPRSNRDVEAVGHPHQKPLKVLQWLVKLTCPEGGTVADPYSGSGTTAAACLLMGRNFIGCEISPEYHAIATKRLEAITAQPVLEFAS